MGREKKLKLDDLRVQSLRTSAKEERAKGGTVCSIATLRGECGDSFVGYCSFPANCGGLTWFNCESADGIRCV